MTPGPGLFGKLPEAGDFISRGLQPAQRRALDRWVTAELAARTDGWPDGGLRGLLDLGGDMTLMVAVASADKVGRRFPFVATTSGAGMTLEAADGWCDGAFEALMEAADGHAGIEETLATLQRLEPTERAGPDGFPALWIAGGDPQVCDAETIEHLFSSGGSCFP
ncbi:MAG: TagF domain-containing protein [Pseudomonadota bacterium]